MIASPNILAYLVLVAWFPISIGLFRFLRPTIAAPLTLLGAMLFLPQRTAIDLPGLPAFDKQLVGNLALLAGVVIFARRRFAGKRIGRGVESLIFLIFISVFPTVLTNQDPLFYGPVILSGMGTWDAVSDSIQRLLNFGIPFVVGRVLFTRSRDLRLLMIVLVFAGIVYSIPILYEVRMSPQLHRIAYGFHQHHFNMAFRLGGWRPMVFMQHGLPLALFVLVTAIAAISLARARVRLRGFPAGPAAIGLTGIFVLCRSLAAMAYGVFLLPMVAFGRPRIQLTVASALAATILVYPAMRALDLFPSDGMVTIASAVSDERADSLRFRFQHENQLLEKAGMKPLFGWGTYGRNRIYDAVTGEDLSVTDGYWIIELGSYGVAGFIGVFGLLLLPIWRARRRLSRIRSERDRRLIAGLALVLAIYSVDLLPNGFLVSFAVFVAGVLTGVVPGIELEERSRGDRSRRRELETASSHAPPRTDSGPAGLRDLIGGGRTLLRSLGREQALATHAGNATRR